MDLIPGQGEYDGFLEAQSEVKRIHLIHKDIEGNSQELAIDPKEG